jgi:hypothetical protein
MSWKSWDFLPQYWDFLHLKSDFPHLKSDFPHTESNLPKSAFYFLQRLSAFFNGFPLSPMAFRLSPMAFQFSSTAFHFPRNWRKSIYGKKYTKDRYSSFVFFATWSPSFVVPAKQYLCLTQQRMLMTSYVIRKILFNPIGKIVLLESMVVYTIKWFHQVMRHPGEKKVTWDVEPTSSSSQASVSD